MHMIEWVFLRYSADLVVVSTLILISGAILTGITFALFATIEINIQEFYFDYVVIHGLVGAPNRRKLRD